MTSFFRITAPRSVTLPTILWIRRRRPASTRLLLFPRSMSAIDDDARLLPGGDEGAARRRAVELQHEIVEGFDHVHQSGHACLELADERGAVGDLAARRVEQGGEIREGGGERGDAGRGDAASGGARLQARGVGQIADEGGGADEGLVAQFLDGAFAEFDLGEIGQVAGLVSYGRCLFPKNAQS